MDGAASRELLRWLAGVATGADPAAAGQVAERLGGLSGRGWLRLDELARRPSVPRALTC